MLSPKEKLILQYLSQHQDRYVSSKEMAQHLSCSDRTVRTYIKSLLEQLEDLQMLTVSAKQGFGYQLKVLDQEAYQNFIADQQLPVRDRVIDINDRHNYILNKLIFEQENLFLKT